MAHLKHDLVINIKAAVFLFELCKEKHVANDDRAQSVPGRQHLCVFSMCPRIIQSLGFKRKYLGPCQVDRQYE